MGLVTTKEEIIKYFTVDSSFDFDTVFPYIELAEDDVKRMLGDAQYEELNDYYIGEGNQPEEGIPELDDLLPYAQRAVVYFAFLKGLDKFNVSIVNNGISIIHNTQLAPASKVRVEKLRISISDGGYDALEYMLEFLEENVDDYPLWETSDAYVYQYEYLISSARKFDELYKINRSRLTFLDWRPTMADVELLQMDPAVSGDFMQELKTQIKAGNVSENNLKVLTHLQKALAYLTAADMQKPNKSGDYVVV